MGKKGGISIFVFIFIFVILAMIYSLTMKDNIEEGLTGRKTGGIKTRGIIMIVVFGAILVAIFGTFGYFAIPKNKKDERYIYISNKYGSYFDGVIYYNIFI